MTQPPDPIPTGNTPASGAQLPRPVVRKMRWPFPWVWLVPVFAAIATGIYLYDLNLQRGAEIVISFTDATGLKVGQTPVAVHGVRVGTVSDVTLSLDQQHALVHVRLRRDQPSIAKTGTLFWMVRPDVSGGDLSGLSTILSGPFIEARPGAGEAAGHFNGTESRPVLVGDGIKIVLHADRLEHLQVDSPVYYRGIQVGAVQDIRFSNDATQVNATAFIWRRYANLVRTNSQFWSVSGTDIKGGLLSGIRVELKSLRSLVVGGVAFATPESTGKPVVDIADFELHAEPRKEWLEWAPKIDLPKDAGLIAVPGNDLQQPGS